MEVISISEERLAVLSSLPMKVKSYLSLEIPTLDQYTSLNHYETLVEDCQKDGKLGYTLRLTFVGMHENTKSQLRSVVLKGKALKDDI